MNSARFFILSIIAVYCVIAVPTKSHLKLMTKEDELQNLRDFPVNDLKALRKFIIASRPNLPSMSDVRLMQFHHGNHYNIKETKRTITTYYEMFDSYREVFENRRLSDSTVQSANKIISQYVAPRRTSAGGQIILAKLMESDSSEFDVHAVLKYFFMAIEGSMYVNGIANNVEVVIDYSSMSYTHYWKLLMDIKTIKKTAKILEEALPVQTKAIHIVNANSFIPLLMSVGKEYISQEFYEKIKIYKPEDMEEFRKNVPRECLAKEYGGTLGSLDSLEDLTEALLKVAESSFAEEEKFVKERQRN